MRPKGWENPYKDEYHDDLLCQQKLIFQKVYEAGATAMLEGLKQDKDVLLRFNYGEDYVN